MISKFREPVSGISHLLGAILALLGMILLIYLTLDEPQLLPAVIIYTVSAILTFMASAIMHLYSGSPRVIKWLVRIDHAAIYLMIAGTYTPLCLIFLDPPLQTIVLGLVWLMAILGMTYKLARWERDSLASTGYYVLMGCIILIAIPELLDTIPQTILWLLIGGGLIYLLGAGVFAVRWPNINRWWGWHEIWHLFVLAGFGFHFFAIMLLVA